MDFLCDSTVGTLYVKAFDVIDGIDAIDSANVNVDVIPDSWNQNLNRDKYEIIETNSASLSEPHVTIAYEQVCLSSASLATQQIIIDKIPRFD